MDSANGEWEIRKKELYWAQDKCWILHLDQCSSAFCQSIVRKQKYCSCHTFQDCPHTHFFSLNYIGFFVWNFLCFSFILYLRICLCQVNWNFWWLEWLQLSANVRFIFYGERIVEDCIFIFRKDVNCFIWYFNLGQVWINCHCSQFITSDLASFLLSMALSQ